MIIDLNEGFTLQPIKLTKNELKDEHVISMNYCHLYYNNKKVSNNIFRIDGLNRKFKDGYCNIIYYIRNKKKKEHYFSWGESVIINSKGDIVLKQENLNYPHHIKGCLAYIKEKIYDLRNGKLIAIYNEIIRGSEYIIIKHQYNFYDKENILPLGIYIINCKNAEIIKLDNI